MCATVVLTASTAMAIAPAALPGDFAPAANAQPATIAQDIYKQNTFASDPVTAQGNVSNAATCQIQWNLQAVYSRALSQVSGNPASTSGWIQNVTPAGGSFGSGHASLQHFTIGNSVRWRVPISVDNQIAGGKLVFHLDDPDYDATAIANFSTAAVEQQNGWSTPPTATTPGVTYAQRFGGASAGYTPIGRTLPVTYDAAAKALTVDIGSMPAKSTAMISFSLPTAGGKDPNAADNTTAYGMRAERNASSIATCQDPGYAGADAVGGQPSVVPQTGDNDLPAGTRFEIPSNFTPPAGWTATVDPNTGAVTTTPPATAAPGESIDVPVRAVYSDGTTDSMTAHVAVIEQAQQNSPGYDTTTTLPGERVDVAQTHDQDLPAGTRFGLPADFTAPDGWAVVVNPNSGAVSVTPPAGARGGESITVPVIATYPDGTTDAAPATVIVAQSDDTDADLNNPGYDNATTLAGVPVEVEQTHDYELPTGTTFALPAGYTPPSGWTVTIDENTGLATVTPPSTARGGESITIPVVATYPDGTTDDAPLTVIVSQPDDTDAELNNPGYDAFSTLAGVSVEVPQTHDPSLPAGTTFALAADYTPPEGWTVEVDENTGTLTVTPPPNARPGDNIAVPVVATYSDDTTDGASAIVIVAQPDDTEAELNNPGYDNATTEAGQPVAVPQTHDSELPVGTTFGLQDGYTPPEGWTVEVDATPGVVTVTPPATARGGESITIPVVARYPDGTTDDAPLTVIVAQPDDTDAEVNSPGYDTATTEAGEPLDVPQTRDTDMPDGTTYGLPDGYTPPTGWTVEIDENTGVLTVTPPEDARPGANITVPVVVTYPDDSTDDASATVIVGSPDDTQAQTNDPGYDTAQTAPGEQVDVSQTGDTEMPEGTTYTVRDGVTPPAGWTVSVDETTGVVSMTPPTDARGGDYVAVPIVVTYPDGSTDNAVSIVIVEQQDSPDPADYDPAYIPQPGKPGAPVAIPQTGDDLPEGTTCAIDESSVPAGWTATLDANCAITITPPADLPDGGQANIDVVFTYPDGTTGEATATVIVPQDCGCDAGGSGSLGTGSSGDGGDGDGSNAGTGSLGLDSLGSGSQGDSSNRDRGSLVDLGLRSLGSLGLGFGSLGLLPGLLTGSLDNGSGSNGSGSSDSGSNGGDSGDTGSLDEGSLGSDSSSLGSLSGLFGSGSLANGSSSVSGGSESAGSASNSGAGSLAAGSSSPLVLGLGSLAIGGLAIGGLIHAINWGMIALPPGISIPAELAWLFPALANNGGQHHEPPAAPGPNEDNGRG